MNRLLVSLAVLAVCLPPIASPQSTRQRGFDALPDSDQIAHGHHYIVAIGIDHYQNWPILGTAVSDATGFANLLTTQFGFEYATEPLTEKNATRDSINSLIDDDLRGKLKPEDDLIVFFAGHGTTRNDKIGDQTKSVGFLVPFEARAPGASEHWSDYLNVEEFLQKVSSLPSSHILVILDSCHSGMALGNKFTRTRADTRFQQDMLRKISRKVITSAQNDQLAADAGPLPNHSLFTGLMMTGLTSGRADSFKQGFITATQLGAYTQHEVGVAAESRQTPMFGAFDLDAGGELIIPLGAGPASSSPNSSGKSTTLTPLETNEIARIRKEDRLYWDDADPTKNFPAARSATLKLCDAADGWACGQAARSLSLGLGGTADYQRAVELARQGCQAKSTGSCVTLGTLQGSGQKIEPDPLAAARLYRDACDQGDLRGCASLGVAYSGGNGVKQDAVQAANLFRKACDGADTFGCGNLARSYQIGEGVPKDLPMAVTLYRKTCDAGYMASCAVLGQMYQNGDGVDKNPVEAVAFYRKACDAGTMNGCMALGLMFLTGQGVPKDAVEATSLYRKACERKSMGGCTFLALQYQSGSGVPPDPQQAVSLLQKSCTGGETFGCSVLGIAYQSGVGVEKDATEAVRLFRKACGEGDRTGCAFLGKSLAEGDGAAIDPLEAAISYRKACNQGEPTSCTNLGAVFFNGTGVAKDPAQAITLFRKACDLGEPGACRNLARMYHDGLGLDKDPTQSTAFLHKACDAGDQDSCTRLKSLN